jgi:hypothetical protein
MKKRAFLLAGAVDGAPQEVGLMLELLKHDLSVRMPIGKTPASLRGSPRSLGKQGKQKAAATA